MRWAGLRDMGDLLARQNRLFGRNLPVRCCVEARAM
jgi:hypothetical protein